MVEPNYLCSNFGITYHTLPCSLAMLLWLGQMKLAYFVAQNNLKGNAHMLEIKCVKHIMYACLKLKCFCAQGNERKSKSVHILQAC